MQENEAGIAIVTKSCATKVRFSVASTLTDSSRDSSWHYNKQKIIFFSLWVS
jgi:hypothetical protein